MTDLLASVIVAVRGDTRVRRLLASLASQTVPRESYEVIVAENGSAALADTDGAHGITRYAHLERASSGAARDAGRGLARGRFLLLTDADCVARPGWIEHLTARLAAGDVAAAGGRIVKHQPVTWAQRHAITVVDGQRSLSYLPALPLPYVAGANAGFAATALREAGGFDPELLSGNDVDACYRLGLRGHRVGLAPDAVIEHDDRATVAAHFRRFYTYAVYRCCCTPSTSTSPASGTCWTPTRSSAPPRPPAACRAARCGCCADARCISFMRAAKPATRRANILHGSASCRSSTSRDRLRS